MLENPEITLDQFKRELKSDLKMFGSEYSGNRADDPDEFPKKMTRAEWDEQLKAWCQFNHTW